MHEEAMFQHTVDRILQAKHDIVIGDEIHPGPKAQQEFILQGILQGRVAVRLICISHVGKEIGVQGKEELAELLLTKETDLGIALGYDGKFQVGLHDPETISVNDIIFIRPDNIPLIANGFSQEIGLFLFR